MSNKVIGCALEVHRHLGPGLLESTYEQCLAHELKTAGIPFKLQHPLPVDYKSIRLDCGYRIDILVEDNIIVGLKDTADSRGPNIDVYEIVGREDWFVNEFQCKISKKWN